MDVDRLKKIEAIFHDAADLADGPRGAFLDDRCNGDPELRREVESLLAADDKFDSLIDQPPVSLMRDALGADGAAESDTNENLIGSEIEQYRIVSLIGEGGMGKVYLARDERLERDVAIKFLSERFATDKQRRERFFREAKSASALNHPNILTVHEIGEFGESSFIVTEFVRGETLGDRIARDRPSVERSLDIASQIASALAAAHAAGIVHRDIKPDNVMIRDDRLVKVLDFGIAKLDPFVRGGIDSEAETRIESATMPGMIIGTPQYMSPEQARGLRVDARSDIFSFGVVLYEMLTGKSPFAGATNIDTIGSILKDEPEPVSTLAPEIPADLERIVEKALRKDREMRYQHIKDVLIDLGDVSRSLGPDRPVRTGTLADVPRATDEMRASGPGRKLRYFGLGALLVTVLASGFYLFRGSENTVRIADLKSVEVANWASSPGEIYSVGSFSPDARTIAFTSTRGGSMNVWVKDTADGDPVQITKDSDTSKNPVWSPDGGDVAYFSTKGEQAAIWRIPRLGGSPQLVTEVLDRGTQVRLWAKSEKIYYEASGELFAADAKTKSTVKITDFSAQGIKPRSLHIAPDEQHIAFTSAEDKNSVIWLANASGQTPKKLFESPRQIKNVVWHADSERILFSSIVDGTFQIFVTDTSGSVPRQLTNSENDCLVLDVSSNGSRILYGTAKEESDLWGVGVSDRKEFSVATAIDSELWPDVSPDGTKIVYESVKNLSQGNRVLNARLLTQAISGGGATQIAADGTLPKYSPDGKLLAFAQFKDDNAAIFAVRTAGGEVKQVSNTGVSSIGFTVLPYNRVQANDFSWSPDSQRIAYVSAEGGRSNIWIGNADGSGTVALTANDTDDSLHSPTWSADGKRIAYISKTNNLEGRPTFTVSIVNLESKIVDPIWSEKSYIRLLGWSANESDLIVATVARGALAGSATSVTLKKLEVGSKKPSEIGSPGDAYLHNLHLSPDRKTIAFTAQRDGKDNVWTMPAGGGEAKQLTANIDSQQYLSSLAWAPDGAKIYFGKQSRFSILSMLTNFK